MRSQQRCFRPLDSGDPAQLRSGAEDGSRRWDVDALGNDTEESLASTDSLRHAGSQHVAAVTSVTRDSFEAATSSVPARDLPARLAGV
jgi:hypothetical protein